MPTIKNQKYGRTKVNGPKPLPERYYDENLEGCDNRFAVVKKMKRRFRELVEHTKANDPASLALCQQAVFIDLRLEALRIKAVETGVAPDSVMVQMTNQLLSLFDKLGVERAGDVTQVSLDDYVGSSGGET